MATKKKEALGNVAEILYVDQGWTQKAISDYLKVTPKTIGNWASEGHWEEKRALLQAAPHRIKLKLLEEFEKVAKGEKSNIDADKLSKIAKALESVEGKLSVQVIISVFQEFDTWMVEEDPQLAIRFTEFQRKFILYKISVDG